MPRRRAIAASPARFALSCAACAASGFGAARERLAARLGPPAPARGGLGAGFWMGFELVGVRALQDILKQNLFSVRREGLRNGKC